MRPSKAYIKLDYCTFVICLTFSTIITYSMVSYFTSSSPISSSIRPSVAATSKQNQICTLEDSVNCVPPFAPFDNKFRTAQKFNLGACVIEKSMSTVLAAIMCLLHNEAEFRNNKRTLTSDMWENRFCKNKNEYKSIKDLTSKTQTKINDWKLFSIVRDPVERFLSGFVDKCILETKRQTAPNKCYGCERNLTCFLQEVFTRAMAHGRGRYSKWTYEDIHFFPQNWHCEFHSNFKRIRTIRYETHSTEEYTKMLNKISDIFKSQRVPPKTIEGIKMELLEARRTQHSTAKSPEREYYTKELRKNKAAMEVLIRLYYYDFVLFGFPFPEI